ncbi:MAG: cupin domain-containing protein [Bacteroidetes bacterium]|nr:MAG: cupin domain-containing protein [Bacteroidota bacterium]
MDNPNAYIGSGLLELYVMGITSEEETKEVERMAAAYPEISKEIEEICKTFETYAETHAVSPHPAVKPMLMAIIDYTERMKSGEPATFPPLLTEHSKTDDYREWLQRSDMICPADAENLFAKIIGYTPQATTAIVWIKEFTPYEIHESELERFLVIEGSCDFQVGDKTYKLSPGDYLDIPLHLGHTAKVTSAFPCKVILQHVAA